VTFQLKAPLIRLPWNCKVIRAYSASTSALFLLSSRRSSGEIVEVFFYRGLCRSRYSKGVLFASVAVFTYCCQFRPKCDHFWSLGPRERVRDTLISRFPRFFSREHLNVLWISQSPSRVDLVDLKR